MKDKTIWLIFGGIMVLVSVGIAASSVSNNNQNSSVSATQPQEAVSSTDQATQQHDSYPKQVQALSSDIEKLNANLTQLKKQIAAMKLTESSLEKNTQLAKDTQLALEYDIAQQSRVEQVLTEKKQLLANLQSQEQLYQQLYAEKKAAADKIRFSQYSTFQTLSISTYAKNPPAYQSENIKVSSLTIADFLASGDRGGDSNYIEAKDLTTAPTETVMLRLNSDNYTTAVNTLNKLDTITIYGIGRQSENFAINGVDTLIPVIEVIRVDRSGSVLFE